MHGTVGTTSTGAVDSSKAGRPPRLALALWNGDVGGAEVLNSKLAEQFKRLGVDVTILFVGTPWPLAERLEREGIPYLSLDFGKGRDVLLRPRRYAAAMAEAGGDGALLVELQGSRTLKRIMRELGRVTGAWAAHAEVAVSDFMLEEMRRHPHARLHRRIYNGVDPEIYRLVVDSALPTEEELTVGFAGRLVPGKGADHLIAAILATNEEISVRLLIAGDGPERPRLEALARELGVESKVEFLGVVSDIPRFWQRCDIAAVPSDTWVESFSMVTLEAMSCAKPIVASSAGAIPELIVDGTTGTLVPPGDVPRLARGLTLYAKTPQLRAEHGRAARARAVECFDIERCAKAYSELFDELADARAERRRRRH